MTRRNPSSTTSPRRLSEREVTDQWDQEVSEVGGNSSAHRVGLPSDVFIDGTTGPRPFGPPGGFGPPGSRPMRQFGTGPPPPGFGAPPPGFVQQRGPPPTFGGGPGFGGPPPMNGAFNQPPPGAFQPQQPFAVRQGMPMPPPGFAGPPPGMAPGFGGGMSPPQGQFGAPPQASFSAGPQPAQQQMAPGSPPPAQSPPGQGVGMQMNPARAAALGLR